MDPVYRCLGAHTVQFFDGPDPAAHFTGANGRAMLRAICAEHGGVHHDHADVLASWLLTTEHLA